MNFAHVLPDERPRTRCGIVAVIGRANAGKSTLVNALVGEKVSIVSPVAQTTRNRIRGIWTEARGQLVFLDTPGVHKATHDLGRLMNRMARASAEGADVVMLVLDATALPRIEDEGWMRRISAVKLPAPRRGATCSAVVAATKVESLRNPPKLRTPFLPVAASSAVVALATKAESHRAASYAGVALAAAFLRPPKRATRRREAESWRRRVNTPLIMALNKTDVITPRSDQRDAHRALWNRIQAETRGIGKSAVARWVEISAKTGERIEALRTLLFELVPEGPLLFPEEMLSDFPRKLMIADIIREKLFRVLKEELPYAVAVGIESITESDDTWTVQGNILVNKPSQKGIVIGQKGRLLQQIRKEAEKELAEMYERRVSLHLWVRVHKNWARDPVLLNKLGYTL